VSTRLSASVTPVVLSGANRHVANRFTFGIDETVTADVTSLGGWNQWLTRHAMSSASEDPAANAVAGWYPRLADTPAQAWDRVQSSQSSAGEYGLAFVSYTLARKIVARRQLHEVMADFWSNLLFIPAAEDRSFPWRFHYDTIIRNNALGTFRALLRETVVHPAMSGWLNNSENTKNGINENLGRELLELYTVGRPAGYTEEDVKNSARILTGFSVKIFAGYASSYVPANHYTGPVSVLGFSHANAAADGRPVVNEYLDYLARHPATAARIARRLCVRFVSDTPSDAIVSAVAAAYRSSDTDIKATLTALVSHPEFLASAGKKVRTPTEDVVNTARVLGMAPTKPTRASSFANQLFGIASATGQQQFGWPRPDGFPETSSTWTSPARVIRTWRARYHFVANWSAMTEMTLPSKANSMPTAWPRSLDDLVEHQSRVLIGLPSTAATKAAVATTLGRAQTSTFANAAAVSDWTWTIIRALVINQPEGMTR